jgi:hypothetical protein
MCGFLHASDQQESTMSATVQPPPPQPPMSATATARQCENIIACLCDTRMKGIMDTFRYHSKYSSDDASRQKIKAHVKMQRSTAFTGRHGAVLTSQFDDDAL